MKKKKKKEKEKEKKRLACLSLREANLPNHGMVWDQCSNVASPCLLSMRYQHRTSKSI